jgi:hypothetical protein
LPRPFFQTQTVALGEIDDRYRNADPGKGIGYPMFTLERVYDAGEIVRNAGFDPYGRHAADHRLSALADFAPPAGEFEGTLIGRSRAGHSHDQQFAGSIHKHACIPIMKTEPYDVQLVRDTNSRVKSKRKADRSANLSMNGAGTMPICCYVLLTGRRSAPALLIVAFR